MLLRLEEQPLANDGTMADYCDVLRSGDLKKPLRVALARLGADEEVHFYSGRLNDRGAELEELDLAVADTRTQEALAKPPSPEELARLLPSGTPYEGYMTITDDTASLTIRAPSAWAQLRKAPQQNPVTGRGAPLPSTAASPISAPTATWATPPAITTASPGSPSSRFPTLRGRPTPRRSWSFCRGRPTASTGEGPPSARTPSKRSFCRSG